MRLGGPQTIRQLAPRTRGLDPDFKRPGPDLATNIYQGVFLDFNE